MLSSTPRGRPQTPRETLARDHNWHMGRLRRYLIGAEIIRNSHLRRQIEEAITNEMVIRQNEYENKMRELI